jgi:hypothetical protein
MVATSRCEETSAMKWERLSYRALFVALTLTALRWLTPF